MRFGPPVRILAVAGVLALALVGLVVRENIARDQGTEVRLALAGYDPRSLLQGHYVRFNTMQELAAGRPCPPGSRAGWPPEAGWVALRREGDHHAPAGQAKTRAEAQTLGAVVVRGGLSCFDVEATRPTRVMLDLGVDRIHLDQEQAEAFEADLRRIPPGDEPPGYAVLSIGRDGKARVKGLIVGDKRADLGWW